MTDNDDARQQLSEMAEMTERTIGAAVYRHADLDALYRSCPTAFWLAPDADETLPPPQLVPATPPGLAAVTSSDSKIDLPSVHGMAGGIGRALIVAGPIFAATALALDRTGYDQRWFEPFGRALMSLFIAPITAVVGGVLALLPVLLGVLALGEAGLRYRALRRPIMWALTGGLMGTAIAAMFDADGVAGLALVATSIACAAVARTAIAWSDPEFA